MYNLSNVLVFSRVAEAKGFTRAAHELKPDSAQVAANLAWLLVKRESSNPESVDRAIALAEQAVELSEKAQYLYFLALAYEAAGRIPQAVGAARAAEDRARVEGGPKLREFIRFRQELERR